MSFWRFLKRKLGVPYRELTEATPTYFMGGDAVRIGTRWYICVIAGTVWLDGDKLRGTALFQELRDLVGGSVK